MIRGAQESLGWEMCIGASAEAVNFAERAGIDASKLFEALGGGFADSKPFQIFGPRMAARDYETPLGTARLTLKDLDKARDLLLTHILRCRRIVMSYSSSSS